MLFKGNWCQWVVTTSLDLEEGREVDIKTYIIGVKRIWEERGWERSYTIGFEMIDEDALIFKIEGMYSLLCINTPQIQRYGPNKVDCITGGERKNNGVYCPKTRNNTDLL